MINKFKTQNNSQAYRRIRAGGRMFATKSSLYFTTGEFRNRPLAQKIDNDYGKILNIEFKG